MHPLHRIYWAIRSNRPNLALELMRRCNQPIVAGLFAAYMYQGQVLPRDFVPDARVKESRLPETMRQAAEKYACDILDNAELFGSQAAFDEYLFYTPAEEEEDSCDKLPNATFRSALYLMRIHSDTAITHLDMALESEVKSFMNQRGVSQFLQKLWRLPSANGKYVQDRLRMSPRSKAQLDLVMYVGYLAVYIGFVLSMPEKDSLDQKSIRHKRIDVVFWLWTAASVVHEIVEAQLHFSSLGGYLRGTGNSYDAAYLVVLLSAGICRFLSNHFLGLQFVEIMLGILCFNMVLCCFRFIKMLTMIKRIGVMLIITTRIIKQDIFPFLVFATSIIVAFEVSNSFFYWSLDMELAAGGFFTMFTTLGDQMESEQFLKSSGYIVWLAVGFQLSFFVPTPFFPSRSVRLTSHSW